MRTLAWSHLDNYFTFSQLGSILSITILPALTRDPSAHQMSIQQCEALDEKMNDVRDYSGTT